VGPEGEHRSVGGGGRLRETLLSAKGQKNEKLQRELGQWNTERRARSTGEQGTRGSSRADGEAGWMTRGHRKKDEERTRATGELERKSEVLGGEIRTRTKKDASPQN